eukprot:4628434-Prymnesium_polylepis.1
MDSMLNASAVCDMGAKWPQMSSSWWRCSITQPTACVTTLVCESITPCGAGAGAGLRAGAVPISPTFGLPVVPAVKYISQGSLPTSPTSTRSTAAEPRYDRGEDAFSVASLYANDSTSGSDGSAFSSSSHRMPRKRWKARPSVEAAGALSACATGDHTKRGSATTNSVADDSSM